MLKILKSERLPDARVAWITKKEYGLTVHFLQRFIKSLKSIPDKWLNEISWSSHLFTTFRIKWYVEFSLFLQTAKYDYVTETREMFNFLPLINNSVTIELSFLLLTISAIVLSKRFSILLFKCRLYSSMFLWKSSKSFEYLLKALESLNYFKPVLSRLLIENWYFVSYRSLAYQSILSISSRCLIKLNKEFVSPDPEPPVINILYGWSEICSQFALCSFMFSFIKSSKLINFCSGLLYCYI